MSTAGRGLLISTWRQLTSSDGQRQCDHYNEGHTTHCFSLLIHQFGVNKNRKRARNPRHRILCFVRKSASKASDASKYSASVSRLLGHFSLLICWGFWRGKGTPPAGLPDMGFWSFSVLKWKFIGDFAIGPGWSGNVTTFTLIAKVYVGCHNFWQRSWWWEQGSCKRKFVLRFLSMMVA